ncbi:MAG: carbohydrate ABC transporter permease [Clostridia bacterium]|nr:carbohydrate ABC transporter permease [Clostridia bacterium]MBQ4158921.1 carbohydrate ABC transporter permease [Clostridia bacterium]
MVIRKRKVKKVHNQRFTVMDLLLFLILTLFAITIVFPFYTSIVVSFMSEHEYLKNPFTLIPKEIVFDSYDTLIKQGNIVSGYKNTLIHLALGMPISMYLTCTLAYALSKRYFPGKKILFVFIMITMVFGGGTVPAFLNIKELGLINNRWSVVLSNGIGTFYVILVMNYIHTLPNSLFDSARIDGANEMTIMFRIVLPLSKPILATVGLFYMVDKWNEWYGSMLYLNKASLYPLQLELKQIIANAQILDDVMMTDSMYRSMPTFSMGIKMAAVVLTMLPIMCVFPFLQKYFVKGVTLGAVKG